jgi:1-acyl-sn-glycerol-3-phosphate acyltransferase
MVTNIAKLSRKLITSRNNLAFYLAKFLGMRGFKLFARPHVEFQADLVQLRKEQSTFLYASLHKSLWETSGILIPLEKKKLPVPYTGMGDNLVRGKFFQRMAKRVGVFLIKRARNRREMLESAKMLKDYIINYIAYGHDVMVFPEGTRKSILTEGQYGKFFPTVFEALLEYEKNKDQIMEKLNLPTYNSYIIPVNVDYSRVREDWEMLGERKEKPRTLNILDSLKMMKNIRDTYITYGKPINVAHHLDMTRKELAAFTREKCLNLVKILPINIVSASILDSVEGDRINKDKIETNIGRTIEKLQSFQNRFRGITTDSHPGEIWQKVASYVVYFRKKYIDEKYLAFYRLYASYIGHYLE